MDNSKESKRLHLQSGGDLIRTRFLSFTLALSALVSSGMPAMSVAAGPPPGKTSDEVIRLNNAGVEALKANNYQLAIQKFEAALKVDKTYTMARENLAIAYNNYGISLQNNPALAVVQFHKSLYYSQNNGTAAQNLDVTIQAMGKDPRKFADRVALAKSCRSSGDLEGAAVEYYEALKLKDDGKLRIELGNVLQVRDDIDRAIEQYTMATKSPGLDPDSLAKAWTSLGQCNQRKQNYPESVKAYNEALKINRMDRETLEANKAVWEETVRKDPSSAENHIGLGEAYKFCGDFGQAAAEYKQAIVFAGSNAGVRATANKLLQGLSQAQQEYERDRHINNGVDLQGKKLYQQAIQEYTAALASDPKNPDILTNIGSAYQQQDDYKNAIDFYNKALAMQPGHPAATQGLKVCRDEFAAKQLKDSADAASQAFKLGQFDQALAKFKEVLLKTPKDPAAHFNIGATYQAMKDLDSAMAEYRQAIALAQDSKDPKLKDYQSALTKAIQDKADPLIEAGTKKQLDKDYVGAIALYQQALALVPDNLKVVYNLAGAYYAREQFADAQKLYQQLVDKDPKNQIDLLSFIGKIYEHQGNGQAALSSYERYLREAPNGKYLPEARDRAAALRKDINDVVKIKGEKEIAQLKEADDAYNSGIKLQQEKRWDEAIAQYQKAMNIRTKEPAYPAALGSLFQQKGDYDQSIKWYQSAIDLAKAAAKPDKKLIDELGVAIKNVVALKAEPIVKEALNRQNNGDYAGACELWKKALELVPDNAKLWTNLGSAYQFLDDFANARTAFQKAVDMSKDESANWFLIAAIDENFGQGQAAIEHYRKYITTAPTGQFVKGANERLAALAKNPSDTKKLPTQGDIKNAKAADDAFSQALKLQEGGNAKDAIPLYMRATQAQPKVWNYWYALGTAYEAVNDFDNAEAAYKKAMDIDGKQDQPKKALEGMLAKKAAPIVDQAIAKYEAKDFAAAAALYGQVCQIVPNNSSMHTSRAAALQAADDFAGARAEYQKAYDLDPKKEKENLYFLGALAENFGQGQQALDLFRKYQTENPKGQFISYAKQRSDALSKNVSATIKLQTSGERASSEKLQTLFNQGLALQKESKHKEAIEQYTQCINLSPTADYIYARGTAYQGAGMIDEAITDYKAAIAKDPQNKDYQTTLKACLDFKAAPIVDDAVKKQTGGDIPGAIAGYREAMKIVPDNARLHTNLASALQQSDDYNGARAEYQTALNMDKKNEAENWYYIGVLDEHFGKGAQALSDYQNYVKSAPAGGFAALAQQRIKALTANPNALNKLTTQAEAAKAQAIGAAYDEGIKLQQESKFDEAIAKYKEALQGAPNEFSIWFALGTAYQNKNDVDEAIKSYEKALSLNPKDAQSQQYLKACKQIKAQPMVQSAIAKQTATPPDLPGAIADYENALKIDDDPSTRLNIGTAYQAQNLLPKALENYKKAVNADKTLVDAYYYMGTVYEAMKQPALAIGEYKKYPANGPNAAAVKERLKILGAK